MLRGFFLLVLLSSMVTITGAAPDLKNMTEIGVFKTTDPHDAEFFKDVLYIADGNSLLVYNTSDPERPKFVRTFTGINAPGKAYGLSISENQLYVATGPGWIYVLNISDPENPKKMYQISYSSAANDVAVSGKYMYVAGANNGMLIFDLTDKINPVLVGVFYVVRSNVSVSCPEYLYSPGTQCWHTTGWGGTSVAISGKYAFLNGANRQGFYIIDVSDPVNPTQIFHSVGKEIHNIEVSGNDVYLARADGTVSFDLLDVSNPYVPKVTGSFLIPVTSDKTAIAVHPSGEYIYAAAGDTWHIFRIKETLPPEITIEKPEQGEIFTGSVINVSGTAFDRTRIMEVLVNGKFAGKESWNQVITLVEGTNDINITALDNNGNSRTELIGVTYRPSIQQTITPVQTVTAAPSQTAAEVTKKPVVNIIFAVLIIASIVLIYWAWKYKIRK